MDFNPKTSVYARAIYEVLGVALFATAFIVFLVLYPYVFAVLVLVAGVVIILVVSIRVRVDDLTRDKKVHDACHVNDMWTRYYCKYCVEEAEQEEEEEEEEESVARSILGEQHDHLHLRPDEICATPGINGVPGEMVRCKCGSYHH